MAATYDASLASERDWVRFFIGDRDVTKAALQDEEIVAVIAEEQTRAGAGDHVKYLAAARCGEVLLAQTKGLVSKQVEDLRLAWGDSPDSAYRAHLEGLRTRGAEVLLKAGPRAAVFRVV